ncbi:MAG: S1C family serine protease, partial [Gemmatimonadales bacterium]
MSRLRWFALAFLLGCSNSAPAAESSAQEVDRTPPIPPPRQTVARRDQGLDESRRTAIVRAAELVSSAVVSVNVTRREQVTSSAFDSFFMPRRYERMVQAFGSGFIVSRQGIVITNQHVTSGAEEIVVTTRDGTDYEATLLGEDPLTDIAVLRIDGDNLPTVALGVSSDLQIGEWVVAFGNPYAYLLGDAQPTVTAGVVSAVNRNLLPSGDEAGIYVGMIQTDAAINPGNSGGPLTNALGEVVGVNSSIFSNTGGSVGIGFAIPIERAIRVANELQMFGAVRRAWTGLVVSNEEDLRGWKESGGLAVTSVAPESPADLGGIRRGDVLVAANGNAMRTFLDWEAAKLDIGVGDSLSVVVRRRSSQFEVSLIVEDLPTTRAERVSVFDDVELITLTPAIRTEFDVVSQQGAVVAEIGDRTSSVTGLRRGDVLLAI